MMFFNQSKHIKFILIQELAGNITDVDFQVVISLQVKSLYLNHYTPHCQKEKEEILEWRQYILKKLYRWKLYHAKVNVLDPGKGNVVPKSIIEQILSELSLSKHNDYELHLTRPPSSCFASSFFEDYLKACVTENYLND